MQRAFILGLGAVLCAAPFASSGQMQAAAQTRPGAYTAPRTSFGQPDLSGYWTNATLTREVRPAELGARLIYTPEEVAKLEAAVVREVEQGNESVDPNAPAPKVGGEESKSARPEFQSAGGGTGGYDRGWLDPGSRVMRVGGQPRTSFLTTPDGQEPPRKPGAPSAGARRPGSLGSFDSYETRSLGERCILSFGRNAGPPMFPNGFYNNNYQFVQTKDAFIIEVEMVHDVRVVRLNSQHRTDGVRPWMGDSIGRWVGDTLVVETTNIPQRQAYRGSWENLKVTEKFTRVGKDRILYQFTIEDPTIWDKPWGGEYEFAPLAGQIYEYACHEGNYALPGVLAGARAEEAAAKGVPAAATGSAP